jgi:hypothetical protein
MNIRRTRYYSTLASKEKWLFGFLLESGSSSSPPLLHIQVLSAITVSSAKDFSNRKKSITTDFLTWKLFISYIPVSKLCNTIVTSNGKQT